MDAKLLFTVLLSLVGLLCCYGETNENNAVHQKYKNLFDEIRVVNTDFNNVPSLKCVLIDDFFCMMHCRFQNMWNNIRNDYLSGFNSWNADENKIQNTYPLRIKRIRYPEFVNKKIENSVLKRRRRNNDLPSSPLTSPSAQTTVDQPTVVKSTNLSQSENTSVISTISPMTSNPKIQNDSSASPNNTVVPAVNMSTTFITMPAKENSSYDSTSIKNAVSRNLSVTSSVTPATSSISPVTTPVTPGIKINHEHQNNNHTSLNNTNGVKVDKMVDENTKTPTSSENGISAFFIFLFVLVVLILVLGLIFFIPKIWSKQSSNRAHYEVRRQICHEDEAATQV